MYISSYTVCSLNLICCMNSKYITAVIFGYDKTHENVVNSAVNYFFFIHDTPNNGI